jgi:hypothetical protein
MGATSMYADVIEMCNVTPTTIISNATSGTASFACPGAGLALGTGPGQITLGSETIYETADFSYGLSTGNTVQTVFSNANFPTGTCTETGGAVSSPSTCTSGGPTAGLAENVNALVQAWGSDSTGTTAFTVSATATVVGGALGSADAGVFVDYDYTVNPSGVPEPATLTLFGSGLLALGIVARKRSKKA